MSKHNIGGFVLNSGTVLDEEADNESSSEGNAEELANVRRSATTRNYQTIIKFIAGAVVGEREGSVIIRTTVPKVTQ